LRVWPRPCRAVRGGVRPDGNVVTEMAENRSGAVEGDAGDGSAKDQANKMASSVDTNKRLRPVNVSNVRKFDGARAVEPGF
jgi:hypothetical protein